MAQERNSINHDGARRAVSSPAAMATGIAAGVLAACVGWAAGPAGAGPPANPPVRAAQWSPGSIAWQQVYPDGTRFALLEGARDRDGVAFSYAFFIPAGVWDGPHWHTASARVFVARGALRLGYGDSGRRAQAAVFPAGSYLLVPAGAHHYDGAAVDTLIFGTAVGPWATHYVDGSKRGSAGTAGPTR